MTRKIMYICDVCGNIAPASYFGGAWEEERLPNPQNPKQNWRRIDIGSHRGAYHVCSDACLGIFAGEAVNEFTAVKE